MPTLTESYDLCGPTIESDLSVAIHAAQTAGNILRENYGKISDIQTKGVGDLVSEVDKNCDGIIQGILRKHYPEDEILSEELSSQTKDIGQRLWIIDPLDATSGYLFGAEEDIPSVMIALRHNMKTQLGVILFPLTGECYYAEKGRGCFRNGEQITTAGVTHNLQEAWIDMNHYGDEQYETPEFAHLNRMLRSENGAQLVTRMPPHSGIVTKIIEQRKKIAAVVHDNNPANVKQGAWDIIPAQILLEEAGGVMVNLKNERVDPYKPEVFIAAGNKDIAETIIDLSQKTA